MKLEVRNHEVRGSNELPGLPYCSGACAFIDTSDKSCVATFCS